MKSVCASIHELRSMGTQKMSLNIVILNLYEHGFTSKYMHPSMNPSVNLPARTNMHPFIGNGQPTVQHIFHVLPSGKVESSMWGLL